MTERATTERPVDRPTDPSRPFSRCNSLWFISRPRPRRRAGLEYLCPHNIIELNAKLDYIDSSCCCCSDKAAHKTGSLAHCDVFVAICVWFVGGE